MASFSHRGAEEYSVDWAMPVGTTVCAARGGTVVVKCKDDRSDIGGPLPRIRPGRQLAFSSSIRTGTIGVYGHLEKDGIKVKVGDEVVGRSKQSPCPATLDIRRARTLHFSVFKAKDGTERESLPVKFRSVERGVATLAVTVRPTLFLAPRSLLGLPPTSPAATNPSLVIAQSAGLST